jgi:hypothetical protein
MRPPAQTIDPQRPLHKQLTTKVINPDDETEDPPPFGQPGSLYVSIDNKLCRRAPILHTDLTHLQLSVSLETLETDRPFEPSFLANMATVYNVLHSCWGKSSWWHHVKKLSKTKNGRQVYRTLHTLLLWQATSCLNRERHLYQAAILQI